MNGGSTVSGARSLPADPPPLSSRKRRRLARALSRLASLAPLLLPVAVAVPAAASRQPRLSSLDARIARARAREAQLASEIGALTGRIRSLEAQAVDVSTRLAALEDDLALHRRRLEAIGALLAAQTEQLRFLEGQYETSTMLLGERIVQIYKNGEPSTLEVVLGARSLRDALDQIDYMRAIAAQDERIVGAVARARRRVRAARARAAQAQQMLAAETRVVAYRRDQAAALRDRLLARKRSLAGARDQRQQALARVKENEREWVAEADALSRPSAAVASQVSSAQASAPSPSPSPAGLVWPISGPITSPFGMRWGKLHPGLDISAGTGTPIQAAASGRVIIAAYSGGYGNLVVIDHGGGLATAYAHQSRIAVGVGDQISRGQVIGYVGSTGFSTGPHLHFEVRVNGSPVDPMGYL